MSDDRDNVIHVSFGRGGGRTDEASPTPASPAVAPARRNDAGGDPLADLYNIAEVARLFDLSMGKLRYWDRSGFIQPSGRSGRRRFYTFQDLISIRVAKALLAQGIAFRHVRQSVDALHRSLPRVTRPLSQLRVVADGASIVVRDETGAFEPATGQQVLDFEVSTLRDDVVRVLRQRTGTGKHRQTAYEHYLEGCRLDEDELTIDQAEAAYRRAIELDPSLSNAFTNLGNLKFRRGEIDDAEQLYRRALTVDPEQPEAHYNLGFLAFERGLLDDAIDFFRCAIERDSAFADAHFNLAMALEERSRTAEAKVHWETYLSLDADGPWAEIARRHLRGHAPPPK